METLTERRTFDDPAVAWPPAINTLRQRLLERANRAPRAYDLDMLSVVLALWVSSARPPPPVPPPRVKALAVPKGARVSFGAWAPPFRYYAPPRR